jgi:NAD(P)-dependent dehydrogenase (short-subunit alcohol dehydrogenase family)
VLVNNAGILERAPLEEHPIDVWDRVISVNLRGYFVCTQAFGRLMLAGDGGSIVNVSSLAGESPSHANGAYCASKAGVLALTRSTAVEWGPRGVRANAVSPGYMPTAMTGHIDADEAATRLRSVPLGRAAETAEIASVIAFLAGPDASYLSGVNVRVDGGLTHARAGRR